MVVAIFFMEARLETLERVYEGLLALQQTDEH
jgi:hypothetical protein